MVAGSPRTKEFYLVNRTYENIKERILQIDNLELKAFFCTLYATMCRVSELVGNEKKNQPGLRKQDITETLNKERNMDFIKITLWNEKQGKDRASKIVPINKSREPWLVEPILEWAKNCQTESLFPMNRVKAYLLCKEYFGFHTHYFRKARTTHFLTGQITGRPESVEIIRRLGGWTSARTMMQSYSEVTTQDIEAFV